MIRIKRRVYACDYDSCGMRTRDYYRANMHRTLTGHLRRHEEIDAVRPNYFGLCLLLAVLLGLACGLW